ncbi:MAG TPA: hypothetical protein VH678_29210 [Xanthobacteraceae bacterium]
MNQKGRPVSGAEEGFFHVGKLFLGPRFAGAGLLARFRHFAPLFIQLGLLLAGVTGFLFLIWLLLLLLTRLPSAAMPAALAALLALLIALIGHQFSPWVTPMITRASC